MPGPVLLIAQITPVTKGVPFWDSGVEGPESLPSGGEQTRVINALLAESPWERAKLAGMDLPGLCELMNGLTEIGIDLKKPEGKDGGTITVKGYKPGKFEISCTVWTREQWVQLQNVIVVVRPRPNKQAKLATVAVDVYHPGLELLGVKSCAVQAITYPQPGKFEGSKVVQFKCIENVPPGPKRATKTAGPSVSVDPGLALQSRSDDVMSHALPVNATPPKPSTVKKNLGPKGPAAVAKNGTS